MTESRTKPATVTVIINGRPYRFAETEVPIAKLKEAAEIPAANLLFLEVPGPGDDVPIPDGTVVHLKPRQHYYDMPPGNFGSH